MRNNCFLVMGLPAHAGVLDAAFFRGKVTSFYGPAGDSAEDNVLMNGLREGRLSENLAAATQQSLLLKHVSAIDELRMIRRLNEAKRYLLNPCSLH
ncbi:MAG: hypothetical protein ABI702_16900 [Burkholderiales bacterium]